MGDVIHLHNGKPVWNFEAYYLESGAYVEEFDTEDGHYIGGVDIPDYPPDVREEALELGIINEKNELIRGKSSE